MMTIRNCIMFGQNVQHSVIDSINYFSNTVGVEVLVLFWCSVIIANRLDVDPVFSSVLSTNFLNLIDHFCQFEPLIH